MLIEVQTVNVDDARTSFRSCSIPSVGATCGDVRFGSEICVTPVWVWTKYSSTTGMGVLRALEHNALVRAWHNGGQGLNLHIGFGETFVAAPKCSFHTWVTAVAAPSGRRT